MEAQASSTPRPENGSGAFAGYSDEDQPLAGRVTLVAAFGASVATAALAGRASGRQAPDRPHPADVVMLGIATHKLSRLLTKAKATSFLRAPFTELQEPCGTGEVDEKPRHRSGVRRALGELLVCPFCMGQWVSAGLITGLVLAPRATRLVAASYSAQALADFLQLAYKAGDAQG
jgi:hypothetical protein